MELAITVLITAYNRREYLREAVESALNQTLPRDKYEVILTKNFDSPLDSEWRRRGIKLIRFDEPGIGKRVAHALPHCRGRVIAFLDDDDWWSPSKFERVARIWRENPSTVYYHDNTVFFSQTPNRLNHTNITNIGEVYILGIIVALFALTRTFLFKIRGTSNGAR